MCKCSTEIKGATCKKCQDKDKRIGNQFWKARSKHGRNKIFENAEILWEAACEYFEWVDDNPLYEDKVFSFQGETSHEPLAKMRAMTIDGITIFLDVDRKTWDNYRSREDFFPVITRIEKIIRTQKFTGAAADLLNPNIIARDLGLVDKKELEVHDVTLIPPEKPNES